LSSVYELLLKHMEIGPIINTHSHYLKNDDFKGFNLDTLLRNSYVNWCKISFDDTYEGRKKYLDKVKFNAYFIWLQKSIADLYDMKEPLTADNWDEISGKIELAYEEENVHIKSLKEICNYKTIILDAYWEPGVNNGYPHLFSATFRINHFLFGYSKDAKDHNGNSFYQLYGKDIKDIDQYILAIKQIIKGKKEDGCIALKSALAYDRGLDFQETSKERAQKVFKANGSPVSQEDIKAFQDYVFFEICKIAAKLELPIQCHTGLGLLHGTNAMAMEEVIKKNPATQFVLFHGGYPWLDDTCGLVHNYPNVYADLCWLPLISTSAAQRILHELIEVGTSDKICWGCDTWTFEESYGALLAGRHVLAKVLSEKINDNYIGLDDAKVIIDNIFYENAKKLYSLD